MTGPVDGKPKKGEAKAEEDSKAGPEQGERILLHPEEWAEPKGRKIISEFHKPGAPDFDAVLDEEEKSDMASFVDFWGDKNSNKISSEYHKDGAPYLDRPFQEKKEVMRDPSGKKGLLIDINKENEVVNEEEDVKEDDEPEEKVEDVEVEKGLQPKKRVRKVAQPDPVVERLEARPADESEDGPSRRKSRISRIERVIDINTIELLMFAVVRALFGRGVRVPIKREGIIDMEIVIKDKDIIFNTNEILFEIPDMAIWRIVFAYKGKPIIEFGRGVKGRVRIHRMRLMAVLLRMWLHNLEVGHRRNKAAPAPLSDETADDGFF